MGENFSNLSEWPYEPYSTLRMRSYNKNIMEENFLVVLKNKHLNNSLCSARLTHSSDTKFNSSGTAQHMAPTQSPCLWFIPTSLSQHEYITLFLKKVQEPQSGFIGFNATKEEERGSLNFSSLPLGQFFQGSLNLATSQPCTILLSLFIAIISIASELCNMFLTHNKEASLHTQTPNQAARASAESTEISELLLVALINKHLTPLPQLQKKFSSLSSNTWKEFNVGLVLCQRTNFLKVFSIKNILPQPSKNTHNIKSPVSKFNLKKKTPPKNMPFSLSYVCSLPKRKYRK